MANDNKDNESASSEKDRFHAFCWTAEDVARELKCSKRMVVKLVHLDRIPYAKVGRLVRFCGRFQRSDPPVPRFLTHPKGDRIGVNVSSRYFLQYFLGSPASAPDTIRLLA